MPSNFVNAPRLSHSMSTYFRFLALFWGGGGASSSDSWLGLVGTSARSSGPWVKRGRTFGCKSSCHAHARLSIEMLIEFATCKVKAEIFFCNYPQTIPKCPQQKKERKKDRKKKKERRIYIIVTQSFVLIDLSVSKWNTAGFPFDCVLLDLI